MMGGYAVAVCHYLVSRLINFLPRSWRVLGECPPQGDYHNLPGPPGHRTSPVLLLPCRLLISSRLPPPGLGRASGRPENMQKTHIMPHVYKSSIIYGYNLSMVKITNARQAESVQSL